MNTFENTTPNQEVANEQIMIEVAQAMREIDETQVDTEKSLQETTDYLDKQEAMPDKETIGIVRSIGEKFKESRLLKAAALGITLISTPAFAENKSLRAQDQNPHQINLEGVKFNDTSEFRKNMNQLRIKGALQPGQLSIHGKNILPNQISHFSRNTLPNATINGGPAYEIAPGIYGDENTIYRQDADGSEVLVGGIKIE